MEGMCQSIFFQAPKESTIQSTPSSSPDSPSQGMPKTSVQTVSPDGMAEWRLKPIYATSTLALREFGGEHRDYQVLHKITFTTARSAESGEEIPVEETLEWKKRLLVLGRGNKIHTMKRFPSMIYIEEQDLVRMTPQNRWNEGEWDAATSSRFQGTADVDGLMQQQQGFLAEREKKSYPPIEKQTYCPSDLMSGGGFILEDLLVGRFSTESVQAELVKGWESGMLQVTLNNASALGMICMQYTLRLQADRDSGLREHGMLRGDDQGPSNRVELEPCRRGSTTTNTCSFRLLPYQGVRIGPFEIPPSEPLFVLDVIVLVTISEESSLHHIQYSFGTEEIQ